MLRRTACQVQFPFVSAVCWNLNNKKKILQAALVEKAGWTASCLTASKASPISGCFLQKHEEMVRRKLSSVLYMMAAAPPPFANSFSSSSSGKLVAALGLTLLPKGKQELLCFRELVGEPVKTFVETLSLRCASWLDVPPSVSQLVEAQFFSEFSYRHGIRQVLLVGKEQ